MSFVTLTFQKARQCVESVSSYITFQKIDRCFAIGEKALNILGYMPYVSTYSGFARNLYGGYQGIAFVISTTVCYIGWIGSDHKITWSDPAERAALRLQKEEFLKKGNRMIRYIPHAFANMGRAAVETFPFGGNLATLVYDQYFQKRMRYKEEQPTG